MNFQLALNFVLAFSIVLSAVGITNGQTKEHTVVKITDAKLAPINMGLDSTQHWLDKMKQGDSRRGETLIRDLEKLASRFNRLPKSDNEQYKFIVNRFATLTNEINAKSGSVSQPEQVQPPQQKGVSKPNPKLFTISRQLDNIESRIAKFDAASQNDTRIVVEQMKYAKQLFESVAVTRHPDYVTITERMSSIDKKLSSLIPQWESDIDPMEYLKQMREKYVGKDKLPRAQKMMSTRELTSDDLRYFLGKAQTFGNDLDSDLPKIKAAVASTGTNRDIVNWIEVDSVSMMKSEIEKLTAKLDEYVSRAIGDTKRLAELDVEKNRYSFVTESVRKNNEEMMARALRTLENVKSIEEAFGQEDRWSSRRSELEQHIAAYRKKASEAAMVTMLPADIGDEELAEIAKKTLAIEKYGVGQIERMIVNAKKVPRDRIQTRFFNNSLETVVRKWDEYQVCTVEKEGDKYVVYFNTLQNFSRGPVTTPIGEWILSIRYKQGEIEPANLK